MTRKIVLGEIRAMQVYTMTKKIPKNICIALYCIGIKSCYENISKQGHKFVLCKFVL